MLTLFFFGLNSFAIENCDLKNNPESRHRCLKKHAKAARNACRLKVYKHEKNHAQVFEHVSRQKTPAITSTDSHTLPITSDKEPQHTPPKKEPTQRPSCEPCNDPAITLFFQTNFENNKSQLTKDDEARLVKEMQDYDILFADESLKEIIIHGMASRTPHIAGVYSSSRKDENNENNRQLAEKRARSAVEFLKNQFQNSKWSRIEPKVGEGSVAGPEYEINDKEELSQRPAYENNLKELFEANKETYIEEALINSSNELAVKKYKNMFEAKYKPFQGLIILIKGSISCEEKENKAQTNSASNTSESLIKSSTSTKIESPPKEDEDKPSDNSISIEKNEDSD